MVNFLNLNVLIIITFTIFLITPTSIIYAHYFVVGGGDHHGIIKFTNPQILQCDGSYSISQTCDLFCKTEKMAIQGYCNTVEKTCICYGMPTNFQTQPGSLPAFLLPMSVPMVYKSQGQTFGHSSQISPIVQVQPPNLGPPVEPQTENRTEYKNISNPSTVAVQQQQETGHVQTRFRRNFDSVLKTHTSIKRQFPPLTPVIDASHPHTDPCTIESCRAKCIVRDLETCIPQCVNYACYCKCPDPDKPYENFTPLPPVQLVPDIQYETPIDYIRPPTSSPPFDNMYRPGIGSSMSYSPISGFSNQYGQYGYYPPPNRYPVGTYGGPYGQGQFMQYSPGDYQNSK